MKLIPVHKLAKEFNTKERNIVNWIKAGKITASKIGRVWMVDRSSLQSYILKHTKAVAQEKYIAEQIQEKEEEINEMIAHLDDFLFSMRSLNKVSPLFRMIIDEMSLLLVNPKMQKAFSSIATGESIYKAAQEYGISYDRMCTLYKQSLRTIEAKCGFLKEYRNRLAELEHQVRELTLLNERKKMELLQLGNKKDVSKEKLRELYEKFGELGRDVLKIYSMSLVDDVKVGIRAANVLKANDIETVEELYKFVAMFGFDRLLNFEGMGRISLQDLKYSLRINGLLDKRDQSPLIDFFR